MSSITSIDAVEAEQLSSKNAVFIDVREPAEFNTLHIPGAKLYPLSTIKAEHLAQFHDADIVIYCQKGLRGEKACRKILDTHPNSKLVNLSGGIEAWQQQGYATVKGKSNVIALDRQVQITIGTLVFCFSLLAYISHTNFLFVPMFMGAGLIFAGISGFCGLARVLALAPWNR